MLRKSLIITLLFVSSSSILAFASNFSGYDLTTVLDASSFSTPSSATRTAPEFETDSMMFFSLVMMGVIAYRRLRNI